MKVKPPLQRVVDYILSPLGVALTAQEKMVAIAIASHTNRVTGQTNPGDATLARETGLGLRTVERAIPRLSGLFDIHRGGAMVGSRRASTSYRLRVTPVAVTGVGGDNPRRADGGAKREKKRDPRPADEGQSNHDPRQADGRPPSGTTNDPRQADGLTNNGEPRNREPRNGAKPKSEVLIPRDLDAMARRLSEPSRILFAPLGGITGV